MQKMSDIRPSSVTRPNLSCYNLIRTNGYVAELPVMSHLIFSCEKQKKLMSDRYCINSTTIKLFPQILRKDAQEVNFSKKLSCVKGQTHSIQNNSKITND